MPIYTYEHLEEPCAFGLYFDFPQPMSAEPLTECPKCEGPVKRIIARPNINRPKSDSELKGLGFTKLVRRDDGVYENVTRRGDESRYVVRGRPETMPDIKKNIRD